MLESEDTSKPKYIQLLELINKDINFKVLRGGEKLLSENELRRKYNVSITIVRKCFDILKHDGLIKLFQGVGIFISKTHVKRNLEKILSFTKNMMQTGLKALTRLLEKKIVNVDGQYCDKLNILPGEKVFKPTRLRHGNETPMLLETRYINLKYCPRIFKRELTELLCAIYRDHYSLELEKAKQNFRIAYLKDGEARLVGCTPSAPAFLVTGVTCSDREEPIEYEESLYRRDEYEFFVEVGH